MQFARGQCNLIRMDDNIIQTTNRELCRGLSALAGIFWPIYWPMWLGIDQADG